MGQLEGKVAIVTGAGQGVGKGIATAYVKQGAAVTLTGRKKETLEKAQEELLQLPGARVIYVVADGSKDEDVKEAVRRTVEEFGRIDILVNNAQTSIYGFPFEETSREIWSTVMESGLFAALRYMTACVSYLKEAHGSIINLVSDAGIQGFAGYSAYASNKEALRGLTRVVAHELGPHNVNVNAMVVAMATEAGLAWIAEHPEAIEGMNMPVIDKIGDPEVDGGGVAVFLASEGGHYLTGETLNVNGGLYMRP
jgi:NAD(P)-dependent dehydrogenase (short-subunit alcohol dehydrogenase family)